MNLIFYNSPHHLEPLIECENIKNQCPVSFLMVLGEPLILRNIKIAMKRLNLDKILIPKGLHNTLKLVQEAFPHIDVEEFDDEKDNRRSNSNNGRNATLPSRQTLYTKVTIGEKSQDIEIPLNACLHYSENAKSLSMDSIIYPWDFLNLVQKVLQEEVTQNMISPSASIAKSSIIEGPCIIEDDVVIDDFCKIIGPTYIGKGSFIGTSSLIRNCMFGNGTRIGFNCEIGKSFFAGNDKISHQNVILDSIIGENVWFGGYSGTANVLLNQGCIRYETSSGNLVNTGTNHFGAVIGDNCAIGASVIILPGRRVPKDTMIPPGTVFGAKKIKSSRILLTKLTAAVSWFGVWFHFLG
jgi:UDP-N-acetylglucosamine diphosphorylase / glucose-1-phosphate thymidylyltransferase / UDP-N-acetylgalactosamine diphosphorylase / glucosamine-1-phosphate N-acetyltransferase / galactosamine-1-phosphate N-acetyltransferase